MHYLYRYVCILNVFFICVYGQLSAIKNLLYYYNSYTSHTEPIFKKKGLLNFADMFLLNKLKFLHKIFHNNLPSYFQTYWEHFTQSAVNYNLRSRILPVPRIYHVYVESLFVYQLVKILNDFESLIIR